MRNKLIHINKKYIFGILFLLISALFSAIIPLFVKDILDSSGYYNKKIIIGMLLVIIFQSISSSIGTYIVSTDADHQILTLREKVKKHILLLPTNFFDANNSNVLTSRILNDTGQLRTFISMTIPQFIHGIIILFLSTIILFYLDWKLGLLILIIFPVQASLAIPIGRFTKKIFVKIQSVLSELTQITQENISNIKIIKINSSEEESLYVFSSQAKEMYEISKKFNKFYAYLTPLQTVLSLILVLSVVLYGTSRIIENTISYGTFLASLFLLFQLITPINNIASFYTSYKRTEGALMELEKILNLNIEDSGNNNDEEIPECAPLTMNNVSFEYRDGFSIKNLDIKIPFGKKVVLVGPSGSGKSTIINLLTKIYRNEEGSIKLGDLDSEELTLKKWRSLFSVVTQDNSLISDTVYNNLVFGLDRIPTDSELKVAIELSVLDEVIESMEDGLDTFIGERGVKISGGQKQRLQIARAILKNKKILILDEATSNLDSPTERKIIQNLNNNLPGVTIIAIAHRLSTIINSDKVFFIENGSVKASGPHLHMLKHYKWYEGFLSSQYIQ